MELFDGTPYLLLLSLGNIAFSIAFFLFLMYQVQVQSFRSRTKKYKFVSEREISSLRTIAVFLAASVGCYSFVLVRLSFGQAGVIEYIVSSLVAIVTGVVLGYVLWNYLSYYYPFILEKRLGDIRFKAMKSPMTGKAMTLLNEMQEDAHLSQKMIDEEDTLSVDYDVWMDDESDYKVIERYDTRFHPLVCESCNFRTLVEKQVKIVREPQQSIKGLLRKHYECTYCGHLESKDIAIPSWDEEGKYDEYDKDLVELAK